MATVEEFEAAAARVKTAPAQPPDNLLKLYALYKQATAGDAAGERPGALDFKGRAKHDAWAALRGMSAEAARTDYVALVDAIFSNRP